MVCCCRHSEWGSQGCRQLVGGFGELLLLLADFFKGCDSGPSVISLCSGEDRGRSIKDSGISDGICIGGVRGRAIVAVVHS